jgi:4-hydroxybenzoate polyprenyltransferase/phosphoserine phosphatase
MAEAAVAPPTLIDREPLPLCVDLDGTLLETDILLEAILALVKQNPWMIFQMPFWLLRGKAYLKQRIAAESPLDVTLLPVKRALISYLQQERQRGRRLVLATASHITFAEKIATHLNLFKEVYATDGPRNLAGKEKCRVLCERFGSGGFDYAANAYSDLAVWRHASGAILVNTSPLVNAAVTRQHVQVHRVFGREGSAFRTILKGIRVHQWAKNLLVFTPLLLSHQILNVRGAIASALAFLAFSLCASGVYLLNDLLDLESDRKHPKKQLRPLACGQMSIPFAVAAIPILTAAAFVIGAVALPHSFLLVLFAYWVMTMAYSFWFKGQLLMDVIVLAALYTMRVIGGGAATGIQVSPWTFAFSGALFLSLALVKRYSELLSLPSHQDSAHGRAYFASDNSILASAGLASGYMSIIVMALYINSPEVRLLYSRPLLLWPICLLQAYFISRFWLLAHRGKIHEDPVLFALKDPVNLVLAAISSLFVAAAS